MTFDCFHVADTSTSASTTSTYETEQLELDDYADFGEYTDFVQHISLDASPKSSSLFDVYGQDQYPRWSIGEVAEAEATGALKSCGP